MSRPEREIGRARRREEQRARRERQRRPARPGSYGRYVGLLAVVILVLITLNTLTTKPNSLSGIAPGSRLAPFAAPLALGSLTGAVNTTASDSGRGSGACSVRKAGVLNICELYEQGPVVLALFVNGGSCTGVLSEMQALAPQFPTVRFAAVAIKEEAAPVRKLIRRLHLSFPVAFDVEGSLASLYGVATCPQVSFAERGGAVQSRALLQTPSAAQLRSRVQQLVRASQAPARAGGA